MKEEKDTQSLRAALEGEEGELKAKADTARCAWERMKRTLERRTGKTLMGAPGSEYDAKSKKGSSHPHV